MPPSARWPDREETRDKMQIFLNAYDEDDLETRQQINIYKAFLRDLVGWTTGVSGNKHARRVGHLLGALDNDASTPMGDDALAIVALMQTHAHSPLAVNFARLFNDNPTIDPRRPNWAPRPSRPPFRHEIEADLPCSVPLQPSANFEYTKKAKVLTLRLISDNKNKKRKATAPKKRAKKARTDNVEPQLADDQTVVEQPAETHDNPPDIEPTLADAIAEILAGEKQDEINAGAPAAHVEEPPAEESPQAAPAEELQDAEVEEAQDAQQPINPANVAEPVELPLETANALQPEDPVNDDQPMQDVEQPDHQMGDAGGVATDMVDNAVPDAHVVDLTQAIHMADEPPMVDLTQPDISYAEPPSTIHNFMPSATSDNIASQNEDDDDNHSDDEEELTPRPVTAPVTPNVTPQDTPAAAPDVAPPAIFAQVKPNVNVAHRETPAAEDALAPLPSTDPVTPNVTPRETLAAAPDVASPAVFTPVTPNVTHHQAPAAAPDVASLATFTPMTPNVTPQETPAVAPDVAPSVMPAPVTPNVEQHQTRAASARMAHDVTPDETPAADANGRRRTVDAIRAAEKIIDMLARINTHIDDLHRMMRHTDDDQLLYTSVFAISRLFDRTDAKIDDLVAGIRSRSHRRT